jgi:predicted thioesterase
LVEVLERMCQRRVVDALDDPAHGATPSQVALVHRAPALPGAQLFVRAWVQRVGWDVVTFELEVRDRFKLVCEGTLTLALQRMAAVARKPAAVAQPAPQLLPRQNLRPAAVFGLFNPAMAGRVLPVLLWCMASILLVAATLLALAPGLEQRTQSAAQQQENLRSSITQDHGATVPLAHPLRAPADAARGSEDAPVYGG